MKNICRASLADGFVFTVLSLEHIKVNRFIKSGVKRHQLQVPVVSTDNMSLTLQTASFSSCCFLSPGWNPRSMLPEKQDVDTSHISPVLFVAVDGEPMCFFFRPSPVKSRLQPLIVAGGGVLRPSEQPGAILLVDPLEESTIPPSTAQWWVLPESGRVFRSWKYC